MNEIGPDNWESRLRFNMTTPQPTSTTAIAVVAAFCVSILAISLAIVALITAIEAIH